MNCSEFQQRLEEALNAHGPAEEETAEFEEHLQQCDSRECAQTWAAQQGFASAIRQWRMSLPQVDLVDRVIGELRRTAASTEASPAVRLRPEAQSRTARVPAGAAGDRSPDSLAPSDRAWAAVATVAAALLLVSLLTLDRPDRSQRMADHPSDESAATVIAGNPDRPDAAETNSPSFEFVESYATMPLSASEFVTDAVVLVVPADLADTDAEPSRAALWADQIEKRLEPIGKELSSAFDALLQAVPKSPTTST